MRLFGKNPVFERLRADPKTIRRVYIQQGFPQAAFVHKKAKQHKLPVVNVPRHKMDKLGRNTNAQGIMADIDDFAYTPYDELLGFVYKRKLSLVFLDEVQDPQNLGAIIRSLGCFGRFAIVLPTHKSVKVTEAVLRIASGGENHVYISLVPNIVNAIKAAKEEGVTILGSVVGTGEPVNDVKISFPVGLVMGSEQKGIRKVVEKHIDTTVTIPMLIDRLSFNVAHATTIFCYEIFRQKYNKTKSAA